MVVRQRDTPKPENYTGSNVTYTTKPHRTVPLTDTDGVPQHEIED